MRLENETICNPARSGTAWPRGRCRRAAGLARRGTKAVCQPSPTRGRRCRRERIAPAGVPVEVGDIGRLDHTVRGNRDERHAQVIVPVNCGRRDFPHVRRNAGEGKVAPIDGPVGADSGATGRTTDGHNAVPVIATDRLRNAAGSDRLAVSSQCDSPTSWQPPVPSEWISVARGIIVREGGPWRAKAGAR